MQERVKSRLIWVVSTALATLALVLLVQNLAVGEK
jgi:hypothetical protein